MVLQVHHNNLVLAIMALLLKTMRETFPLPGSQSFLQTNDVLTESPKSAPSVFP